MSLESKIHVTPEQTNIQIKYEETNFKIIKNAFLDFYRSYDILASTSRKNTDPDVAVTYGGTRYLKGRSRKVIEICCPNVSKLHHISQRNPVFSLSHSGYIDGQLVIPRNTTYRKMPVVEFVTKDYLYKIYFGTYKLSESRSKRLSSRLEEIREYSQKL